MFDKKIKEDIINLEMSLSYMYTQFAHVFAHEIHRISDEIREIEKSNTEKEIQALQKLPLINIKVSLIRMLDEIHKLKVVQTECSKEKFGVYPRCNTTQDEGKRE